MKIKYVGALLFFMAWAVACNWWYLCKIKNLCDGAPTVLSSVAGITPEQVAAPEPVSEPEPENAKEALVEVKAPIPSEPVIPVEPQIQEFTISFQLGTADVIDPGELEKVKNQLKSQLEQGTITSVLITGHTCNLGSDSDNFNLGMERASMVKSAMIKLGLGNGKIKIVSEGENQPLNNNSSESERKINRRAEIVLQ
ncbi:MAG: OmpA family protein [Bacteroidetes bacterium]|nr:OmpA family protein [Bacteroidota bacterium]